MVTIAEFMRLAVEAIESSNISYMVTGSIAAGHYGENRYTNDVDIVIFVDEDDPRIEALCSHFPESDFYVSQEAAKDAAKHGGQFKVITRSAPLKIDFMISRRDLYDRTRLFRRQRVQMPDVPDVEMAAPEDVMLKKMQYYKQGGSEKHLRDITGIMKISGELVDIAYVEHWADELDVREVWDAICRRLGR
ncbi:nucleotidyl transferase AbiEii/AbiGii toxin family protein [Planctomycetales bacterium ZRK34]|nr:nucleotidyl transferase AbiEii/AbiGii toxin family protein [Planctomycetales bacterium ZRK34]